MRFFSRSILSSWVILALTQSVPAWASDAELDALNLESAPVLAPEASRSTRFFVEAAVGNASQRYLAGSRELGRASLDLSYSARLAPGWSVMLSDRLDYFHPRVDGTDVAVNSLREAYLSWQSEGGQTVLELGRINLRYGPGYGYNPTDFFRDGALRVLTTADPFAMRENRMGTVMLRGQKLWSGGSLSVALAPKLETGPSSDGWSLDLGATNHRDRALVALGTQFTPRISSQLLLYKETSLKAALGFNLTALLSDAVVAHMEWTRSSEPDLLSRVMALPGAAATRNRLVGGLTYTTRGKLSLTAEVHYNGFGVNQASWQAIGTPALQLTYLREALRLQDLAPRQAYLVYVKQKSLWLKGLDLAAYLRVNAEDQSRLAWLELRHHWPSADLTLQWQQNMGSASSEFGILPDRRVVQLLGTFYF